MDSAVNLGLVARPEARPNFRAISEAVFKTVAEAASFRNEAVISRRQRAKYVLICFEF
jgi:hypothetical protein